MGEGGLHYNGINQKRKIILVLVCLKLIVCLIINVMTKGFIDLVLLTCVLEEASDYIY